jgi:hypothetical protein
MEQALVAAVRSCLAARAAPNDLDRVAALANAHRHLDTALHQAVHAANRAGWSWRALAARAGWSFQTLYRRYHTEPPRPPRRATRLRPGETSDLMEPTGLPAQGTSPEDG